MLRLEIVTASVIPFSSADTSAGGITLFETEEEEQGGIIISPPYYDYGAISGGISSAIAYFSSLKEAMNKIDILNHAARSDREIIRDLHLLLTNSKQEYYKQAAEKWLEYVETYKYPRKKSLLRHMFSDNVMFVGGADKPYSSFERDTCVLDIKSRRPDLWTAWRHISEKLISLQPNC